MIYGAFVLVIGKVQTKKDCYRLFERVYLLKLRSCISFALRFKWNRIQARLIGPINMRINVATNVCSDGISKFHNQAHIFEPSYTM